MAFLVNPVLLYHSSVYQVCFIVNNLWSLFTWWYVLVWTSILCFRWVDSAVRI